MTEPDIDETPEGETEPEPIVEIEVHPFGEGDVTVIDAPTTEIQIG